MGQYCTTKRAIGLVILILIIAGICYFVSSNAIGSSKQQQTFSPPDSTKDILLVNLVGFFLKIIYETVRIYSQKLVDVFKRYAFTSFG